MREESSAEIRCLDNSKKLTGKYRNSMPPERGATNIEGYLSPVSGGVSGCNGVTGSGPEAIPSVDAPYLIRFFRKWSRRATFGCGVPGRVYPRLDSRAVASTSTGKYLASVQGTLGPHASALAAFDPPRLAINSPSGLRSLYRLSDRRKRTFPTAQYAVLPVSPRSSMVRVRVDPLGEVAYFFWN